MPKHGGRGGLPRRWMCGLVRIRVRAASEARNFLGGSRPGSAGLRRRPAGRAAAVARCPSEFAPGCCRPRAWHRGGSAQGSIQVKGLIGETGRRRGTLRANTESDVQTAWGGVPGIQITDRLVQTCWADRGFPASCAKKGRRPDGGRYKSSLADGSLPGYPSICSGNPFVKRTRSTSGLRLFIPKKNKMKTTLILLILLVITSVYCAEKKIKSKILTEEVRKDFEKLEFYMPRINKFMKQRQTSDLTLECATCGVVVNEIFGMLEENRTDEYIEQKLKTDVCDRMGGTYQYLCDVIVDLTPLLIKTIANKTTASIVCVDLQLCSKPFPHHNTTGPMPSYTINLDLPADQRWNQVCGMPEYAKGWQKVIQILTSGLPDKGKGLADVGREINNFLTLEYGLEIIGCAKALGVDYGFVTLMQLGYEISDACTSIVAQDPMGNILHSRNIDFWDGITLTEQLKDIAGIFNMEKGGKTLFKYSTFVGYFGALSGQKPGGFSVTIDTRFYPNGLWEMFDEIVFALENSKASLVAFLTRTALENLNTFDQAVKFLGNTEIVADVYYTIAGVNPGEGIVLARNRTDTANFTKIDVPGTGQWFVLITNYDWWKPQPWFDDRYGPAKIYLNEMGYKDCSLDGLFKVMSTKPVLNLQTVYTFLSIPKNSTYETYLRWCNYPCVQ
jgi:hypothetical protein